MYSLSRTLIKAVAWIAGVMTFIVVLHIGGPIALRVGQFSPLIGAFIGGGLTLYSALARRPRKDLTEQWIGAEQVSWLLIGFGILMWAVGDSCWRYYISMGETPFPSIADLGYSLFPVLAFAGLLLLPAPDAKSRRLLLLLDSLISMGSLLAIAWYLLLGNLAQAPGEASIAKFLGLYYPCSDAALLSCVIFLLLRGQGRAYQSTARRVSLLLVGLGMCFFVTSDFLFNIQQNAGTYVEATWVDLGWPLGMMTIGIAAYVRRFLPATPEHIVQERMEMQLEMEGFSPLQLLPYVLLGVLFFVLTLDILASDAGQQALRPVLLFATLAVMVLVVARQLLMMRDNVRLAQRQAAALEDLAEANQRVEQQSLQIAKHNAELEQGIEHLKNIQASIANGNLQVRASLSSGALLPLAGSLNLMAERLSRLGQVSIYAQRLLKALHELSSAFERYMAGGPFVIPESCSDMIEINHLLVSMHMKGIAPQTTTNSAQQQRTSAYSSQQSQQLYGGPPPSPLPASRTQFAASQTPPSPHPTTQPLTQRNPPSGFPLVPPSPQPGVGMPQRVLGVRRTLPQINTSDKEAW